MVTPKLMDTQNTTTGRVCKTIQSLCQVTALLGGLCLIALAGCSSRYSDVPAFWPIPTEDYTNYGPGRFKTSLLAQQIDEYYRGAAPGPIGVTTFVNIDDLYSSSTFGRMVGEQLISELAMKGFDVIELRHSDALQFLDSSGEFALSRDVRAVRPQRTLAAVVVGTYVVSPERVYLNARLIQPSTSLVLSAGSVEMSKTTELAKLLRTGSTVGSLERIPVKPVGYASQYPNSVDSMRQQWIQEESGWSVPQPAAPSLPESRLNVAPKVDSFPSETPQSAAQAPASAASADASPAAAAAAPKVLGDIGPQ